MKAVFSTSPNFVRAHVSDLADDTDCQGRERVLRGLSLPAFENFCKSKVGYMQNGATFGAKFELNNSKVTKK